MIKKNFSRKRSDTSNLRKQILKIPKNLVKKETVYQKRFEHQLLPDTTLYCCYEVDKKGNIIKVVTTSLVVTVNEQKHTIARLDSEHGYLHLHRMRSIQDQTEDLFFITDTGSPHVWLTTANNIIQNNYISFRKRFLQKSGLKVYY